MTKNPLKVGQPSLERLGKIFAAHPVRPMDDLLNFGRGGCLELWLRIHGRAFRVDCASVLDPNIWAKREIPNHRRYAMVAWRRTRWSATIRKVAGARYRLAGSKTCSRSLPSAWRVVSADQNERLSDKARDIRLASEALRQCIRDGASTGPGVFDLLRHGTTVVTCETSVIAVVKVRLPQGRRQENIAPALG